MRQAISALRLFTVALALALCAATPASAYDGVNDQTLIAGDTPYRSVALFDSTTPPFDTANFTVTNAEKASFTTLLACSRPNGTNAAWGAKTAWVRLPTAVAGVLNVDVASNHDVFYSVYAVPSSIPAGTASENQLVGNQVTCFNGVFNSGGESYLFGHAIPANRTIYVQVQSICQDDVPPDPGPANPCDDNERAAAPAGNVTVRLRFKPDNGDNDGVADSIDSCPTTPGPVDGCPDADGDGRGDPFDACPTVRGRASNGCRLADEDGDHYGTATADPRFRDCDDDNASVNPGARETRGNQIDENCDGLAAFDRDGDNYDDAPGPDCNPARRGVHPGARDVPGNKVDEDCDGKLTPYPRATNEVAPSYLLLRGRTVGFASFKVLSVRKGMAIRIECNGARCPYPARTFKVKKTAAELTIGREFRRRLLPAGAFVTLKITRSNYVGRALRFTLHKRRGKPKIRKFCLKAGTTKPLRKKC